jgi:hypothetical protein
LQIKTKIVSSHTADSKPVKLEVNGTVILPPLVFPALNIKPCWKGLPGTNVQAYFAFSALTKKKVFTTLTIGVNNIKLFSLS